MQSMIDAKYKKEDGIQLGIGDGNWYLFFDRSKDFYQHHYFNEKKRIEGVLYWRNFGRIVLIKDVKVYVNGARNPKRADQRHQRIMKIQ